MGTGRYGTLTADGSAAQVRDGNLYVNVRHWDGQHHSTTRADARRFAKAVWGDKAEVLEYLGTTYSREPYDGYQITLRRYSVVIVGSASDLADAMDRALNTGPYVLRESVPYQGHDGRIFDFD